MFRWGSVVFCVFCPLISRRFLLYFYAGFFSVPNVVVPRGSVASGRFWPARTQGEEKARAILGRLLLFRVFVVLARWAIWRGFLVVSFCFRARALGWARRLVFLLVRVVL